MAEKKKKILHITPWYPHSADPKDALWIKRHVECLQPYYDTSVLHILWNEKKWIYKRFEQGDIICVELGVPAKYWRLREWLVTFVVMLQLRRMNAKQNFELVNFHIAYPMLTHLNLFRKLLPAKLVITEHWSAYHFDFGIGKKIERIQRVFSHGIPLIAVSHALENDIRQYSGFEFPCTVIHNIVETQYFHFRDSDMEAHFLTVAKWKDPKDPFSLLNAVIEMKQAGNNISLRIGGVGPMIDEIKQFIDDRQVGSYIHFIGPLTTEEFALELSQCSAFILPSEYETFSVVVAEALCCGCPVLADEVGGITERLNAGNGIMRKENQSWTEIIQKFMQTSHTFDRKMISSEALAKYNAEAIGKKYREVIENL